MSDRSGANRTVAALRRGRKAITAIEGQLEEIRVWVVDPSSDFDFTAVDRLAASNREAGEAMACLGSGVDIAGLTSHSIY